MQIRRTHKTYRTRSQYNSPVNIKTVQQKHNSRACRKYPQQKKRYNQTIRSHRHGNTVDHILPLSGYACNFFTQVLNTCELFLPARPFLFRGQTRRKKCCRFCKPAFLLLRKHTGVKFTLRFQIFLKLLLTGGNILFRRGTAFKLPGQFPHGVQFLPQMVTFYFHACTGISYGAASGGFSRPAGLLTDGFQFLLLIQKGIFLAGNVIVLLLHGCPNLHD